MSVMDDIGPDPDMLAAEYILRLLDEDQLSQTERRLRTDPAFAAEVADWEAKLAPLIDAVPSAEPPAAVWQRIQASLDEAPAQTGQVIDFRRRERLWRGYGLAMTALAASLALVVGLDLAQDPVAPSPVPAARPAPMMVAALSGEDTPATFTVTVDPVTGSMLVTPARASADPAHSHELWVIPAGGAPISVGLLRSVDAHRMGVPQQLAPHFRSGATLAISVEPQGGSPTGQPTGPVIASGALNRI